MTVDDVDLFIFHQSSKMSLDMLQRLLKIRDQKLFRNIQHIGNTVSASIPIAIHDALAAGLIRAGSRVLISGFGAGLSWATAIVMF